MQTKKTEDSHSSRRVAKRVEELKPSGIRKFFDLIIGRDDIISLGVGEPDFPVPWRIREEMIYSLEKGYTSYTSNYGLPELRDGIAEYYRRFSLETSSKNVLITTGASEAIDLAIRAIIEPGDRVILPEPCYVSYRPLVSLCGGEIVSIPTNPDFKLNSELIEKYVDEKTKAIILNYPANPTGVSYRKNELEEIADSIIEHELIVVSDEIYAELTFDYKHVAIASLNGMEDRVITINGFSKAFSMTGMRVGYIIAPDDILAGILKIHQYCMLCAPITAQIGAIEALKCLEEVEKAKAEYLRRRNYLFKKLSEFLEIKKPEGTFYAFPNISSTGMGSEEFAEKLLFEKKVAVVPGNAFGECGEGYVRLAFAVKFEKLKEALDRMEEFVYAKG
ncbi:MAG: aminotransferase class I/II-fold pyridoxal phosphate-dependent enzyme [Archaeoglobaceae archaeon]|nr:aminotransferase class I/II-fold pyridoxal phosphate-dependent enzyme [Archaeoglobaceae archaeon]MDW8118696.1 aminotransferase class I/II-fold pyridoxal phosphate-dependent enzyme [Archaeoglobaceae archaeon]